MNKQQLVTRRQAIKLKQLGFHDKTCAFAYEKEPDLGIIFSRPWDYNKKLVNMATGKLEKSPFVSVPTVHEAVDWLGRKLPSNVFFSTAYCVSVNHKCKNKFGTYRRIIDALIKEYEKR